MNGTRWIAGLVHRLARALLRLYPPAFRRELGSGLLADLRRRSEDRRAGGPAGFALWSLRTLLSLLVNAAAEWLDVLRGSARRPASPAGVPGGSRVHVPPSTLLETVAHDLRFGLRQLGRRPGMTLTAVLSLGIGIGAATAIFNAAEVALYRPLPFEHQDRLVRVYRVPEAGTPRISLRPQTLMAVERRGRFFDRIVGQRYTTFARPTETGPERVVGIAVTAGWVETLGVRTRLGRAFTTEEERQGAGAGVVLLSHHAWERWFGGDTDVLGRQVVLNDRPYTVVGVMQPGLQYPYHADLWLPLRAEDEQLGPWSFNALARLRPGVSVADARAELHRIAREAAASGEAPTLAADGMTLTAVPFRELFVADEGRITLTLLGGVGFLLLIVCANLANLLLARGLSRRSELAVRASLGASRPRLVRQLLTESLLLGGLGSGLGILLAHLGSGLAQPLLPEQLESVSSTVSMNGTVLGFAVGLALLSTLLFGLLPALRLSRAGRGAAALRTRGTDDAASRRIGASLVVAELALGIVLLAGAGLILQDLRRLGGTDLGYEPAGLLTFSVSLSGEPYDDDAGRLDFIRRAAAELTAVPDVSAAGITTMFPSTQGNALAQVEIEGRDEAPGTRRLVNHRLVDSGYFDALGVQVLSGRGITARDRADSPPIVVVSASMADRFWPDSDPIGQRVRSRASEDYPDWMTVVGVVEDVREFWDVDETWYLPLAQYAAARAASNLTFAARGRAAPPPADIVRRTLAGVAPDLPVVDLATARQLHEASLTRQQQAGWLSLAFAAFGLLLAGMGIYGSVSYNVARRRREFGIRLALGSEPRRILGLVMIDGLRLTALGVAIGALGALAVSRILVHALTEVTGLDPVSFGAAILVLAATAVAATLLPARRAARADPVTALADDG